MNVGVVGCGSMGSKIARKLLDAGHQLLVYDASETTTAQLSMDGASVASSVTGMQACDVVFLSLPGPTQVQGVIADLVKGDCSTKTGAMTIVDTSTVSVDANLYAAKACKEVGIEYIDAPILGRPASVGSWTMVVGGEEHAYERVRPLLHIIASNSRLLGPSGSGTRFKLLNQLLFGCVNLVYCEVFALAEKIGIGATIFGDTIQSSGASTVSNLLREISTRITQGNFEPDFSINLLVKDLTLAQAMVRENSGRGLITGIPEAICRLASAAGYGKQDNSAMYRYLCDSLQKDEHGTI